MKIIDSVNWASATAAVACMTVVAGAARGEEWPQYRGPNHDGKSTEKILERWPAGGPRVIWKAPTTDGFSSLAVGGGKAFTLVAREVDGVKRQVCIALDADTGKELWAAPLSVAKYDGQANAGTSDN